MLRHVQPVYPTVGRKLGLDATVVLEISVDSRGRPASIEMLRPAGFGFGENVRKAVEQWLFARSWRVTRRPASADAVEQVIE
ncbi:MAG: TonB family protein [Acidobacteria bacterium]|nr:TonB family protein [Acidobacteriota bacterium]